MGREGAVHPPEEWMKLDNAAKIYPAITGSELTGVFRISVFLSSPVVLDCTLKSDRGSLIPLPILQCRAV